MVTESTVPTDDRVSTAPASLTERRGKRGRRSIAVSLLFALTLTAGIAGGMIGALVTRYWPGAGLPINTVVSAQPVSLGSYEPANIASLVYSQVGPAVVEVQVYSLTRRGQALSGSGSGIVIDPKGLILTNHHVVSGSQRVSVRFSSGDVREAKVVSTDLSNDLALLKVDLPANIPTARLGDSDSVKVGQLAIAIGNPFGLEQTVTQGIISAVGREWQSGMGQPKRKLLQTDAPVNPGNSGGPLVNAAGEVIGITNMIESPVEGSVGVGFAIPINTAKELVGKLV